jgi:Flp pilus assembly protein TadD
MSLLMAALRKEEAKRNATATAAPANSETSSPAYTTAVTASDNNAADLRLAPLESAAPELDEHAESVTATTLTPAAQASAQRNKTRTTPNQRQAAAVFQAKEQPAKQAPALIPLLSLLAAVVVIGGGVLWYMLFASNNSGIGANPALANYDLQNRGFLGENTAPANRPATAATTAPAVTTATTSSNSATAPITPPAAASTRTPATPNNSTNPTVSATTTNSATVTTAAASDAPSVIATASNTTNNESLPVRQVTTLAVETAASAGPALLEIQRATRSTSVPTLLQTAYQQLQQGNLQQALSNYQNLWQSQPNNPDVLLGLAATQLQLGNPSQARQHYNQVLKLNPQNPFARAGLLQTLPQDPTSHEQELLALQQTYPALPSLQFALGNLYASQQRWHEAQSAYFNALAQARRDTSTSVSPDYAFNLAISLDQLKQTRSALEYYRLAAELNNQSAANFDPAVLRQRINTLEQTP